MGGVGVRCLGCLSSPALRLRLLRSAAILGLHQPPSP